MARGLGLGELWIAIKVETQQMAEGFRKARQGSRNFVEEVKKDSAAVRSAGMQLSVIGFVGAMAFGLVARQAARFHQAMANVRSVTGGSADEMQRLEKIAREAGRSTVFSATEAANALYYYSSAGFSAEESAEALQGALDLAAATGSNLAAVTETLATTISAFNMEAADASKIANVFAASISSSQATMAKLTDSMRYVAPAAAKLNISFEETAAALSVLYNAGMRGSMAGTAMRNILTKLLTPSRKAEQTLAQLGLTFSDISPATNSLAEIIDKLAGASMGATEAATLFRQRGLVGVLALAQQGGQAIRQMTYEISNTSKASEMAQMQMNTFEGAMKQLRNTFEDLAIATTKWVLPALKQIAQDAVFVARGISSLNSHFMGFIGAAGMFLTINVGLTGALSVFWGHIKQLEKATGNLTKAFWLLGRSALWINGIMLGLVGIFALVHWAATREDRQIRKIAESTGRQAVQLRAAINAFKDTKESIKGTIDESGQLNLAYQRLLIQIPNLTEEQKKLAEAHVETAEAMAKENLQRLLGDLLANKLFRRKLNEYHATERRVESLKKELEADKKLMETHPKTAALYDELARKKVELVSITDEEGKALAGQSKRWRQLVQEIDDTKAAIDNIAKLPAGPSPSQTVTNQMARTTEQARVAQEQLSAAYDASLTPLQAAMKRRMENTILLEEEEEKLDKLRDALQLMGWDISELTDKRLKEFAEALKNVLSEAERVAANRQLERWFRKLQQIAERFSESEADRIRNERDQVLKALDEMIAGRFEYGGKVIDISEESGRLVAKIWEDGKEVYLNAEQTRVRITEWAEKQILWAIEDEARRRKQLINELRDSMEDIRISLMTEGLGREMRVVTADHERAIRQLLESLAKAERDLKGDELAAYRRDVVEQMILLEQYKHKQISDLRNTEFEKQLRDARTNYQLTEQEYKWLLETMLRDLELNAGQQKLVEDELFRFKISKQREYLDLALDVMDDLRREVAQYGASLVSRMIFPDKAEKDERKDELEELADELIEIDEEIARARAMGEDMELRRLQRRRRSIQREIEALNRGVVRTLRDLASRGLEIFIEGLLEKMLQGVIDYVAKMLTEFLRLTIIKGLFSFLGLGGTKPAITGVDFGPGVFGWDLQAQHGMFVPGTTHGTPVVVGERNTPEVIAPLDKLEKMLAIPLAATRPIEKHVTVIMEGETIRFEPGSIVMADDQATWDGVYDKLLRSRKRRMKELARVKNVEIL